MPVDRDSTLKWMSLFADAMTEHRQELVRLDTAIGDGDHGTNMDRGMQKAVEKLHAEDAGDAASAADPGAILKSVAMTLISTVGGAAGPLYGTVFLQLGNALAGQAEVDLPAYATAWRKAVDGVMARGKAQPGDKTMMDALVPAVRAAEAAANSGEPVARALQLAAEAARSGAEATRDMIARYGRAKFLGEKTRGSADAGATSMALLFQGFSAALAERKEA